MTTPTDNTHTAVLKYLYSLHGAIRMYNLYFTISRNLTKKLLRKLVRTIQRPLGSLASVQHNDPHIKLLMRLSKLTLPNGINMIDMTSLISWSYDICLRNFCQIIIFTMMSFYMLNLEGILKSWFAIPYESRFAPDKVGGKIMNELIHSPCTD